MSLDGNSSWREQWVQSVVRPPVGLKLEDSHLT